MPGCTTSSADRAIATRLRDDLATVLEAPPTATNPSGLRRAASFLETRLQALRFDVRRVAAVPGGQDILVATRQGRGAATIGLTGHYDVEEAGAGWRHDPFEPKFESGRLYGRGVADNLGPLWLRLFALEELGGEVPSLVLLLEGEEEVGSPTAHRELPGLELPAVDLWVEETGYFESDGRQRMLLRRPTPRTEPWIAAATVVPEAAGREVERHDRYLNKAFGAQHCPFLTHLVGDSTYLAIGPNDPESRIHQADESIPTWNLDLSVRQFQALLRAAAAAS